MDVGQHNYRRLLVAGSKPLGLANFLGAVEVGGNDGPWSQPENLDKLNAVFRLSSGSTGEGFALTGMAYQADWTATEHVPERAITSGEIGRYGALSPNDGGKTHRYSLAGDWAASSANGASKAGWYVIDYALNLFSAPSGYTKGSGGDQHEQADARTVWGGQASHCWFLGPDWLNSEVLGGIQVRQDHPYEVKSLQEYHSEITE